MIRPTGLLSLVFVGVAAVAGVSVGHTPSEAVEIAPHESSVDVIIGGRPFTTFFFDSSVAKPYFHPLRTARGTIVTRGFPVVENIPGEDRDEPHQRPMYFGHGDINGFDFWGEAAYPKWSDHPVSTFGRTVFRSLDEARSGAAVGTVQATFDLVAPAGILGREIQRYQFSGDGDTRTIDCQFSLVATDRPLVMGDTKEGTFAIRVVKALDSPPGRMVNADNATGEKHIWGRQSAWVDYYGRVGDEEVGVAVLDHPGNLRSPTYWHARAYGLLAANPFGISYFARHRRQSGAYTIPARSSLVLRYRVVIHHGDPVQGGITEEYRRFAAEEG
jgi:Family of unknown function (DUF6807)